MNPLSIQPWQLLAVVAFVGAVYFFSNVGSIASGFAQEDLAGKCRELRARYQDALDRRDTAAASAIARELQTCIGDASRIGAADPGAAFRTTADDQRQQIDEFFAEYKATSYSDPIRRDNIRGNIYAVGRAMVSNLTQAIVFARTETELSRIEEVVRLAYASSVERFNCQAAGAPGCDRFGFQETSGGEKARAERAIMTGPLDVLQRENLPQKRAALVAALHTVGTSQFEMDALV